MVAVLEETSTVTLDVKPSMLVAAFTNAAAWCSKESMRPVLHGASIEWTDSLVRIVATDSYRLLVQELPRNGQPGDEGQAIVGRDDLVMFVKYLKAADKLFLGLPSFPCLLFDDRTVTCRTAFGSVSGRLIDAEFPNWRQLGSDGPVETGTAGVSTAVIPKFLADFGKLAHLNGDKNACLIIEPAETALKPFRFELKHREAGQRVYGLLMPVRTS